MSKKGQPYQTYGFKPDPLILPILNVMWSVGITTRASCHGHIRGERMTGPYLSFESTHKTQRFLKRMGIMKWCLTRSWKVIETLDRGTKWINLYGNDFCKKELVFGFRFVRTTLRWDIFVMSKLI